jgi:hypothetical protein
MKQKFLIGTLFTMTLILTSYNESQAREVLVSSKGYLTSGGCLVVVETYEHRFLGINWYTTTETSSPNCPAYND